MEHEGTAGFGLGVRGLAGTSREVLQNVAQSKSAVGRLCWGQGSHLCFW